MGIYQYLMISQSVTKEEWADVYEETLQLARELPLAELRSVPVRGIDTCCVVHTEEREVRAEWTKGQLCRLWNANGDYEALALGEDFGLEHDLIDAYPYDADAPDPMFSDVLDYFGNRETTYEGHHKLYSFWGSKTQGEPYHIYLLAIGSLVMSRLGTKAYLCGDFNVRQCEIAVRMANKHLEEPIHVPDQCDLGMLYARVKEFPQTELGKLHAFDYLYLGAKDATYGAFIRSHFSQETLDDFCREKLPSGSISEYSYTSPLEYCLMWGFDLEHLCSLATFIDNEGNEHYEHFIKGLIDTKVYVPLEDRGPALSFDPNKSSLTLAESMEAYAWAMRRGAVFERYIPLEEIRSILSRAMGDACPTDHLIDKYVLLRACKDQSQPRGKRDEPKAQDDAGEQQVEAYDIQKAVFLPFYEAGDTMPDSLKYAITKNIAYYWKQLFEEFEDGGYHQLLELTPRQRCQWLAKRSTRRSLRLRDVDWVKVYDDILERPESFKRYYPAARVACNTDDVRYIVRAFVVNDDLYAFAMDQIGNPEA